MKSKSKIRKPEETGIIELPSGSQTTLKSTKDGDMAKAQSPLNKEKRCLPQPHGKGCRICKKPKLAFKVADLYLTFTDEKEIRTMISRSLDLPKRMNERSFRKHIVDSGLYMTRLANVDILADQILGTIDINTLTPEQSFEILKLILTRKTNLQILSGTTVGARAQMAVSGNPQSSLNMQDVPMASLELMVRDE